MNLPAKVAIKKTAVDIEETDKAVERIHTPAVVIEKVRKKTAEPKRKPSPTPPPEKAKTAKSAKTASEPLALFDEPTTRITLDLPATLYKGAKIKSFNEMMTLRSYIIELLRADLNI